MYNLHQAKLFMGDALRRPIPNRLAFPWYLLETFHSSHTGSNCPECCAWWTPIRGNPVPRMVVLQSERCHLGEGLCIWSIRSRDWYRLRGRDLVYPPAFLRSEVFEFRHVLCMQSVSTSHCTRAIVVLVHQHEPVPRQRRPFPARIEVSSP